MAVTTAGEQIFQRMAEVPAEGDGGSQSTAYLVNSDESDIDDQYDDVIAWLGANAPASLHGHLSADVRPKEIGNGWWRAEILYSNTAVNRGREREGEIKLNDDSSFSFTAATRAKHITMSESLAGQYPAALAYPTGVPFAIGYDGHEVKGIDILAPEATWQETYHFDPTDITTAYRLQCLELVGKLNDATFKGAAAGQVLLTGVQGSQVGSNPWQLDFTFAFQDNDTTTFRMWDGTSENASKVGWQIYDVRYRTVVDNANNTSVKWPAAIFVQDVYKTGDFSLLEIGTT